MVINVCYLLVQMGKLVIVLDYSFRKGILLFPRKRISGLSQKFLQQFLGMPISLSPSELLGSSSKPERQQLDKRFNDQYNNIAPTL